MGCFYLVSTFSGVFDRSIDAGFRGFNGVIRIGVLAHFSIFMILFRVLNGE